MLSGKRKKRHDKDKYYNLAKVQGYRSRAAYKLIQINKKYDFLSKAKVCIDLCAAPGGWCQVAAKYMPKGSIILGLDLLPIRAIRGVKTFVMDITTPECRALVKKELQGMRADVVVCDGAPNVGGNYNKDAYLQNEIALMALKCAVDHLGAHGTFCTKVYRSQDYNALVWVFKQLFDSVQAIKPSSSRAQSAEIFVLCTKYRNPDKIDPRLLDPKHVFDQGYEAEGRAGPTIFHKSYEKQRRQRGGYDAAAGVTMHRALSVTEFVEGNDPVRALSDYNALVFEGACAPYREHAATTDEIKACLEDLKVLNKGDFTRVLRWRLRLRKYRQHLLEAAAAAAQATAAAAADGGGEGAQQGSDNEEGDEGEGGEGEEEDSDAELEGEISKLKAEERRRRKREKKKQREKAAKLRLRQAAGMEHRAFDLPEHESVFSLAQISGKGQLEAVRDVDLAKLEAAAALDRFSDDDEGELRGGEEEGGGGGGGAEEEEDGDSEDEEEGDAAALETQMAADYERYLERKDGPAQQQSRAFKKSQKARDLAASVAAAEEAALYDGDQQEYMKMLTGGPESSDEEDEGGESDIDSSDEEGAGGAKKQKSKNPLLVDIKGPEEQPSAKVARWFSNPLFAGVGDEGEGGEEEEEGEEDGEPLDSEPEESEMEIEIEEGPAKKDKKSSAADAKKKKKHKKKKAQDDGDAEMADAEGGGEGAEGEGEGGGDAADRLLAAIPKSDKERRREKRKKALERKERAAAKRAKLEDTQVEIVARKKAAGDTANQTDEERLQSMAPEERKKELQLRALIRKGFGKTAGDAAAAEGAAEEGGAEGFEVAAAPLARRDPRGYGSDEEVYNAEDKAEMLALGAMMLRRSRAKELVDASYNRYAWNDPADLPDWFVDDESKHHRPQLPIPKALVEKMKERFIELSAKPIKKVAEARARKQKRAMTKLKAAKKQANALASNPEMSERQKLKAIQQAMKKGGKSVDRPGKVYVVAGSSGARDKKAKGKVKFVDSRMRSDTRGMDRAEARKKGMKYGKKGKGIKKARGGGGGSRGKKK